MFETAERPWGNKDFVSWVYGFGAHEPQKHLMNIPCLHCGQIIGTGCHKGNDGSCMAGGPDSGSASNYSLSSKNRWSAIYWFTPSK